MATDSFKFWDAYYDALKFLQTDEQRGEFVMALCQYVFDGIEPTFDDKSVEFGFLLVRESARESKEISARAREAGRKGGIAPKKSTAKRGAKSTASSTAKRGAKSEEKRSDISSMSRLRDSGAYAAEADAPPPAPSPEPSEIVNYDYDYAPHDE